MIFSDGFASCTSDEARGTFSRSDRAMVRGDALGAPLLWQRTPPRGDVFRVHGGRGGAD